MEELDDDNNVDLKTTMWKVLRCKPPLNNILQKYETTREMCRHELEVGDIVKFGRVNFKVCAFKCEGRIKDEVQGGYHLLEKKNLEVLKQMEKLQEFKTDKTFNENQFGNEKAMMTAIVDNTANLDKDLSFGTFGTFDRE